MNKYFSIESYSNKDMFTRKGENFAKAVALGVELGEDFTKKNCAPAIIANKVIDFSEVKDYDNKNKLFQTALFQYVFADETWGVDRLPELKNPNRFDTAQRERYYAIVSAVQTVLTPAVTIALTGAYNEVRNIGWGETAEFNVESNEPLIVTKGAEGIRFGGMQHKARYTKTINTETLEINFETDWYLVASGKADFGLMFFRASQGFASYFTVEAYNSLATYALQVPAYLRATGFTTENIDSLMMAVQGANNGALPSLVGTLPALRSVVPDNDFFKMGVGEEWIKNGYVGVHADMPLVKMTNLINPVTMNSATTASFLFNNDRLFVLPFVGKRPIKTVFEGDMYTVNLSSIETADKTEKAVMKYRAKVDYIPECLIGMLTRA